MDPPAAPPRRVFQTPLDAIEDSCAVLMESIPEPVLRGPDLAAIPIRDIELPGFLD